MAEVIRMPRMSDTMEEGVIASWLKKVGDEVKSGDVLAEVETEYVLVSDIARSCISENFLHKIITKKGDSDSIVPYLKVST